MWWFFDKPEKDGREAVGAALLSVESAVDYEYEKATSVRKSDECPPSMALIALQKVVKSLLSTSGYSYVRVSRYAMASHDSALLRFWLQCCQEASKMKRSTNFTIVTFLEDDFIFALKRGYVEEIAEMIKITGVELPLDALIKKSGIAEKEKPKYYQGLSIGGKKMTGWARERGGNVDRSAMSESTPPLLQAARAGSLPSVEWFLSDTPLRLYKEYKDHNKEDTRLRKLADAPGGFQAVVGQWLKQRSSFLYVSTFHDSR